MNFFKFFYGLITLIVIVSFVSITLVYGLAGWTLYHQDFSKGIRPVVEKAWCGYENCLSEES